MEERKKNAQGTKKIIEEKNDRKTSKFDENYKPTDPGSSVYSKHKKTLWDSKGIITKLINIHEKSLRSRKKKREILYVQKSKDKKKSYFWTWRSTHILSYYSLFIRLTIHRKNIWNKLKKIFEIRIWKLEKWRPAVYGLWDLRNNPAQWWVPWRRIGCFVVLSSHIFQPEHWETWN